MLYHEQKRGLWNYIITEKNNAVKGSYVNVIIGENFIKEYGL